ncbi:DedA family protein [Candidatus Nanohalococcus occultus]|uniref:Membrane-associated protein, DedA family n=1 Tax=Candidatus Nanohalococcus occultus TaxID=2978047 RepID=A0ABY8CIF2_9ARCH|nr:putative membrane-associated protein, DedA family [Candidatus Nanohaloarchaeota archaeon SVXNc]
MIEQQIIELIQQHGVLAVMAGAMIEEILVPIPSPLIPMAAGSIILEPYSMVQTAALHAFFIIALPASIASVISSYFVYAIAYFGGEPIIRRYGKYLDLRWDEVQQLERHFGGRREKYLVFAFRAIPIVPLSLVSGAAGLFQMEWKSYSVWTFMGMLPRNFALAMLGWYFADSLIQISTQISSASRAVAVLTVATVGGFILYRKTQSLYKYLLFEKF